MPTSIRLSQMPLLPRDWYYLLVSSMEQIIGGALSTVAGIIIPLILLLGTPKLSAFDQGLLGASGLIGIALGSIIIGQLMDRMGYLLWFRFCPIIIILGSIGVYFSREPLLICFFLFLIGLGVGGGYSLDSGYLSEIMPAKWQSLFVGLAKASSSLGFFGGAAISYLILLYNPNSYVWPVLILIPGVLGVLTLLMRIRWYQSPRWLLEQGKTAEAEKAAKEFMGSEAFVLPLKKDTDVNSSSWNKMLTGKSLQKVILSGFTWLCEGLGVYGFGVFLPILVMALGIQGGHAEGLEKVMESVKTTAFINIFVGIGFGLGLAVLNKVKMVRFMGWNFIFSAIALAILLVAFKLGWATWISFLSFIIFELALNAGPHLVTFVLPSRIFSIAERGAGTGIATMLGKIGAVLGVFFMPLLLKWGGITLVLSISMMIMLLGAGISFIYAKKLGME